MVFIINLDRGIVSTLVHVHRVFFFCSVDGRDSGRFNKILMDSEIQNFSYALKQLQIRILIMVIHLQKNICYLFLL